MSDKASWSMQIKQVDNGYQLNVVDQSSYKTTETVYRSVREAIDSLRQIVLHVEKSLLLMAPPEDTSASSFFAAKQIEGASEVLF